MNLSSSVSAAVGEMSPRPDPVRRQHAWAALHAMDLPSDEVLRGRLPAGLAAGSAAAQQFDVLRTKMLGVIEERRWSRVGVTQPHCRPAGAYAAANLALSLARRPNLRILLIDLDLRSPSLAQLFGLTRAPDLGKALRQRADLRQAAGRVGANLAIVCNAAEHSTPAETLQDPNAAASINRLIGELQPDVTLLLLAPILEGDAGLSGLPMTQTVLVVSDGTSTVPDDLHECDRLIDGGPPILGVVLVDAES